jgi:hypothetical protein
MSRAALYIYRSYGRNMNWSYDKCELLADEYASDQYDLDEEMKTEKEYEDKKSSVDEESL